MKKIMVAEDDPEVFKLFKYALENAGYTVVGTNEGQKVISDLLKEKPDLLILDVNLPHKDGYSILLDIENDPELSRIPVIVSTVLNPARKLFDKMPQVAAFLEKPFDIEVLLRIVDGIFKEKVSR